MFTCASCSYIRSVGIVLVSRLNSSTSWLPQLDRRAKSTIHNKPYISTEPTTLESNVGFHLHTRGGSYVAFEKQLQLQISLLRFCHLLP